MNSDMNSFSGGWLALREPADQAAHNLDVQAALKAAFAERNALVVWDLGAGTGSSIRSFSACLPDNTQWVLIDQDQGLLDIAAERHVAVVRQFNLASGLPDPTQEGLPKPDLITASAFLDLTSEAWINALAAFCAAQGCALLATLCVDGTIRAEPDHPMDEMVFDAFVAHQTQDKGFGGPAAGPQGGALIRDALAAKGFNVTTGASPWVLTKEAHGPLMQQLLSGIDEAVSESGPVTEESMYAWIDHRQARCRLIEVGHLDVLALPPA
ncbi:MAG: hypothetical protein ACPGOY_12630 [Rhodospirillaceae bacterium]